ncbi:SGNH/GDSL hydrolase family protein [Nocardia niwae]|uniref:SGNH/GDSL hydrolase family protein n=1 Tax=Nocardia niwae TaxID=626084 RepID=A0ABV2X6V6_9NOCA|nr:SGNH/GDSL hydrolase family protein [Nocardia niwae]
MPTHIIDRSRERRVSVLLAAFLVAGAVGAAAGNTAPASQGQNTVYVALGDSYAAGGMPPIVSEGFCGRSGGNYAHVIAQELGVAEFRDATCGGAKVADFTDPRVDEEGRSEPAQYDALTANTTLVTVGIGGNDIGLLQLGIKCYNFWRLRGAACDAGAGPDGYSDSIGAYTQKYGEVIQEIRARAPRAEIIMVGYPTVFQRGGCPTVQPLLPTDSDYFQARIEQLNAAMQAQSTEHGALYVDLLESTRDHGVCAPPEQRWLEGPVTVEPDAVPLHPNSAGHANAARQILAAVRGD